VSDIWIPGTRNSGSFLKFGTITPRAETMNRTQAYTIPDQMICGIRYFDIRLRLMKDQLHVYHSTWDCEDTFIGVLNKMVKFLSENKSEFLVVMVHPTGAQEDNQGTPEATWRQRIHDGLTQAVPDNMIWTRAVVPTLKEARGKIVMIADVQYGLNFLGWGGATTSEKEIYIQNNWDGPSLEQKWKDFLELWGRSLSHKVHQQFFVNIASCTHSILLSPKHYAESMNEHIMISLIQPNTGAQIIALDFPSCELVQQIISKNFEKF